MPYPYYQLKIVSEFNRAVYRIVEISGNRTFAELSDVILDAFAFDRSHLYMFSLKRKPYDPQGIYHPLGITEFHEGQSRSADQTRLQDVNPVPRNKYLYLYDFGDDWMFYITVMKVREADQEVPSRVIESKGELCQYPGWEEEDSDEEMIFSEEDMYDDTGAMVITFNDEEDQKVKEKLSSVPALLQNMWLHLIQEDLPAAGPEEMEFLYRLERADLVELDVSEEHLYIKVKRGKMDEREYGIFDDLQERCELENRLLALMGYYGVVKKSEFYELFVKNTSDLECTKELFEDLVEKLSNGVFWGCAAMDDGKTYIGVFHSSILEEIVRRREKYPVKWYYTLSEEMQEALQSGDWRDACPVYYSTFHYLLLERGWAPEEVGTFLRELAKCVALGYTEQEYLIHIQETLTERGLSLTKPMRRRFLQFRNECPSAVLKGHTWGEYEKSRKDGLHQLSLFEEELPFS